MKQSDIQNLKEEFGIHFANSPGELKFLEAFIEDLEKASRSEGEMCPSCKKYAIEKTVKDLFWQMVQAKKEFNPNWKDGLRTFELLVEQANGFE
jgi:hypothetical protein